MQNDSAHQDSAGTSGAGRPVEDTSPLLLFDSGVGGLSILAELRAVLPQAPLVYAADFAGLPYGEKSEAEISARVPALLGRLVERYRPRMAVIACNTASTIALPQVRSVLDIPVVGTVPAIKPAASLSQSRVIGILGTRATVRQPYVDDLAARFAADVTLLRYGAPELVEAAEMVLRGETPDAGIFARAMAGLTDQPGGDKMDVVVLACTHFPLVEAQLAQALGRNAHFVHGAQGIARRITSLSEGQGWAGSLMEFIATGEREGIAPYQKALEKLGFTSFDIV